MRRTASMIFSPSPTMLTLMPLTYISGDGRVQLYLQACMYARAGGVPLSLAP